MTRFRHVVVTPAHNEARHLPALIASMCAQTARPDEWLIVDDASTDESPAVLRQAARVHPWIRTIRVSGEPVREVGSKVATLVTKGISHLDTLDWDVLSKIDADLRLPPVYFSRVFEMFESDAALGIAGGACYVNADGRRVIESVAPDHTRGALKSYRRQCYQQIGGIRPVHGWDGIDTVLAQMHGWRTRHDPSLLVEHFRPTGTATGVLKGRFTAGRFAYFMGYHPLWMAARVARRLIDRPPVFGALSMGAGYLSSVLLRKPQLDDPAAVDFLRQKQLRDLAPRRLLQRAARQLRHRY